MVKYLYDIMWDIIRRTRVRQFDNNAFSDRIVIL